MRRAQPLARALAKLRTYRFIAGVPDDVTYDDSYINLCTYAGELLDKVGKLTHDPPHPAGVDDEAFKLGHDGCGRSNIFSSADIVGSVDAYMDDSDAGNIDRLGHRRWILNPKMGMTGFGAGSHYSAMYSFDGSRKDVPDYGFVSYPPPGYCPHDLFNASHAWHVSFNPAHYKVGDDVKAAIYPVDLKLNRANEPLEHQLLQDRPRRLWNFQRGHLSPERIRDSSGRALRGRDYRSGTRREAGGDQLLRKLLLRFNRCPTRRSESRPAFSARSPAGPSKRVRGTLPT